MERSSNNYHFDRGYCDAIRGKGCLFRKVRDQFVPNGDPGLCEWDQFEMEQYMDGYEKGCEP